VSKAGLWIGSGFNDFVDHDSESGSRIQGYKNKGKNYLLIIFLKFLNKMACCESG
jgi:hypothetical protein